MSLNSKAITVVGVLISVTAVFALFPFALFPFALFPFARLFAIDYFVLLMDTMRKYIFVAP